MNHKELQNISTRLGEMRSLSSDQLKSKCCDELIEFIPKFKDTLVTLSDNDVRLAVSELLEESQEILNLDTFSKYDKVVQNLHYVSLYFLTNVKESSSVQSVVKIVDNDVLDTVVKDLQEVELTSSGTPKKINWDKLARASTTLEAGIFQLDSRYQSVSRGLLNAGKRVLTHRLSFEVPEFLSNMISVVDYYRYSLKNFEEPSGHLKKSDLFSKQESKEETLAPDNIVVETEKFLERYKNTRLSEKERQYLVKLHAKFIIDSL